jgi:hypothetical protein
MAGLRAKEVNRPSEVRAYGLTLGIGGAQSRWRASFAARNPLVEKN